MWSPREPGRARHERQSVEGRTAETQSGRERRSFERKSVLCEYGAGEGGRLKRSSRGGDPLIHPRANHGDNADPSLHFFLLPFLGEKGRQGEAENCKLIPKNTKNKFSSIGEASKGGLKGVPPPPPHETHYTRESGAPSRGAGAQVLGLLLDFRVLGEPRRGGPQGATPSGRPGPRGRLGPCGCPALAES